MNANRIINMVIRMVMNRVLRTGMNAGINALGNKKGRGKQDETGNTASSRQGGPDTRQTTKRAKQALRAGRRIGRF